MSQADKDSMLNKSFDSVELTEAIVLTRTRAPDLESVKKLNCWASNIGDVSVVRRMPALEVCSLSINKITSLRDFAHCYNLKELYVRTNKIGRLEDIHYLKHLQKLRSLWLSENPCASEPNYRMTVLRTLPNLRKLDNIAVTDEEVLQAVTEGNELPIPEDFSNSSLFNVNAFSRSNSKPSSSPTNLARSIDLTKSVTDSVLGSVGIFVENGVGKNVSFSDSDCKWALPRRRRQQKKREEMMRSCAGEDGGGSARSGEDSSGPAEGKGYYQVNLSSDSHMEDEKEGDCHDKRSTDDETIEKIANLERNGVAEEEACLNSNMENRDVICSFTSIEENEDFKENVLNGKHSNKRKDMGSLLYDSEGQRSTELQAESPLGANHDSLTGSDCGGSINILRISELEISNVSESCLSNNNSLVCTDKVSGGEYKDNSKDIDKSNCNTTESHKAKDLNLNVTKDGESIVVNQFNPVSAKPLLSSFFKVNEHSLLDQIRLDDSLDVVDSATEEKSPYQQEIETSQDLEHLEVENNQVLVSSVRQCGQQEELKARGATAALIDSSLKQKSSVPNKPKTGLIHGEELDHMKAELGIRAMSTTQNLTSSSNSETPVVKNCNVLQAVLCLLKELDKEDIDIVDTAVKTRIEELR